MGMVNDRVAAVARGQLGLVTWEQLPAAGAERMTITRWLAEGRLERLHPGVFRVGGAPVTYEQALLAAVLAAGAGAAVSHRAAALLWELIEDGAPVEVSVTNTKGPRLRGVLVHRSRDLGPRWVTRRHGIPVTNPLLTMVDLGAVLPPWLVEDALNRGLTKRLFTIPAVERARNDVGRPGRRGAGVLRAILDERALGGERPDGLLEARMAKLLQDAGLDGWEFQFVVVDEQGRFVARVDFCWPDRKLVVEVDGFETHSSPAALQADLDRQNRLVTLGYTVLRFTWADVVRNPSKVVAGLCTVAHTPRD
jgi:very-short-patch-repair endonuclease